MGPINHLVESASDSLLENLIALGARLRRGRRAHNMLHLCKASNMADPNPECLGRGQSTPNYSFAAMASAVTVWSVTLPWELHDLRLYLHIRRLSLNSKRKQRFCSMKNRVSCQAYVEELRWYSCGVIANQYKSAPGQGNHRIPLW